jgi:lipooligosaccharide transport system permease protein
VADPVAAAAPGALAFAAQRLTAHRHHWRSSLVSGVLEPALYLAAMGVGLGGLVDGDRVHVVVRPSSATA